MAKTEKLGVLEKRGHLGRVEMLLQGHILKRNGPSSPKIRGKK